MNDGCKSHNPLTLKQGSGKNDNQSSYDGEHSKVIVIAHGEVILAHVTKTKMIVDN